ncbi:MAG: N-acetyltransferase [Frankiales bacterium]|nr:N-acetyltransferase [Frankiales bacterium]
MTFTVGTIGTPRLLVRPFREDDLDAIHALQSDPEVVRYLPWLLRTREESQTWLAARIAASTLEADDDAVAYAVERRDDGRVLGSITLFLRSIEHEQGEIGFVLERSAQGQGYAAEATAAVLDLAFPALDLHRVVGKADARNTASATLMQRLGMRQEAHLRECERFKGEWGDLVVYAVLREEWDRLRGRAQPASSDSRKDLRSSPPA